MTLKHTDIQKLGDEAVKEAQAQNRKLGIPNVYCIDGKIMYELPDGTLSDKCPK